MKGDIAIQILFGLKYDFLLEIKIACWKKQTIFEYLEFYHTKKIM